METILIYIFWFVCLLIFYGIFFYVIKPGIYIGLEYMYRKVFKVSPNKPVSRWILYAVLMSIIFLIAWIFA